MHSFYSLSAYINQQINLELYRMHKELTMMPVGVFCLLSLQRLHYKAVCRVHKDYNNEAIVGSQYALSWMRRGIV
jgi:hypothetical protein